MFNVFELIDLLFTIIKFKFHKKKYDYSYKKIYDLNNPNFINYIKTKKFHLVSLFNCPQIIKKILYIN